MTAQRSAETASWKRMGKLGRAGWLQLRRRRWVSMEAVSADLWAVIPNLDFSHEQARDDRRDGLDRVGGLQGAVDLEHERFTPEGSSTGKIARVVRSSQGD